MVNASLNWASIVGIVLAVCGGGLYFLRSFKPALARDYDVFFAAIGLLCGGILFFQGWRLDPILQFGQFLLAGTTVFFAYESVRLRGVATDQARRSSFFEDEQIPNVPRSSSRNRFGDDYDQFPEPDRTSRRFKPQDDDSQDDYFERRSRRNNISRAIPESAVSRRRPSIRESDQFASNDSERRRIRSEDRERVNSRRNNFGDRRASRSEVKRGSRPTVNEDVIRQKNNLTSNETSSLSSKTDRSSIRSKSAREQVEDASFTQSVNPNETKKIGQNRRSTSTNRSKSADQTGRYNVGTKKNKLRDNSSRFDD